MSLTVRKIKSDFSPGSWDMADVGSHCCLHIPEVWDLCSGAGRGDSGAHLTLGPGLGPVNTWGLHMAWAQGLCGTTRFFIPKVMGLCRRGFKD